MHLQWSGIFLEFSLRDFLVILVCRSGRRCDVVRGIFARKRFPAIHVMLAFAPWSFYPTFQATTDDPIFLTSRGVSGQGEDTSLASKERTDPKLEKQHCASFFFYVFTPADFFFGSRDSLKSEAGTRVWPGRYLVCLLQVCVWCAAGRAGILSFPFVYPFFALITFP